LIPARNRERKCSTCKHYQASPLWRKGWCRNLLYDRNTNHLVEADTLACNRTFIDYWEPLDTSRLANGAAGEQTSTKPRIAPSVPLEQVDRKGNRRMVGENTPATGMPAARNTAGRPGRAGEVPPRQVLTLDAQRKRSPLAAFTEQDDLLDEDVQWPADPKATQQIEEITGPQPAQRPATTGQPASRTTKKPRPPRAPSVWTRPLPIVRAPLWMALALLAVLAIAGGSFLVLRSRIAPGQPTVASRPSVTVPAATATGFGDPTATVPPQPTTQATAVPTVQLPPEGTIGVNGYVQVSSASGLVVRAEPSISGARVTVMPNGTKAKVIDGPVEANGYTWWKVTGFNAQNPALEGWCAQTFLRPTSPP
jgi:hypothetical protein